ncbi:MAG TPA: MBL fold metallo-hydrolase [Thermoanaerobaculia bacterium]|nr:MBL fold metallo-hydrolase [Thermoanaerobaculia bacterium]
MKRFLILIAGLGVAAVATIAIAGRVFSAPRYEGPPSNHFDGERFHNLAPAPHGEGSFIKWILTRERGFWPDYLESPPAPPPPSRVGPGELRVTFINHATTLIQFDGINVLTDPTWSERASPVTWAGPRRRRPPGVRFEDLPPIDAVVISHNHYDHMNVPTLRRLREHSSPVLVMGLGNDRFLESADVRGARSLDWWQSLAVGESMRIHVVPAQHFSARGLWDRDANLWAGFVLETAAGSVYFAGDTGWGPHFGMVRSRFPSIRLAILPIGAFLPRWFMAAVHIGPEEAIRAFDELEAEHGMVMHFGTFPLGDDGMTDATTLMEQLLERRGDLRQRIWIPAAGESREFPVKSVSWRPPSGAIE